jgi:hypothetical protein
VHMDTYKPVVFGPLKQVDWLRWGETDVSELRLLPASCSSPSDCDVDYGMMVPAVANP